MSDAPQLSGQQGIRGNEPELSGARPKCPDCGQTMHKYGEQWKCNRMACLRQKHGSFSKAPVAMRTRLEHDPKWFSVGSTTPAAHIANVRAGRHPMGYSLSKDPEATCGNCALLRITHADKTYFKCGLFPDIHSPNYDIRRKWAGCDQWSPRTTESEG